MDNPANEEFPHRDMSFPRSNSMRAAKLFLSLVVGLLTSSILLMQRAQAGDLPVAGAPREKTSETVIDEKVREAVKRSLPFVEKGGVDWIEKRGCMSCHTFAFTIWAHQEAKLKGFDVSKEKMSKWLEFARKEAPGKRRGFLLDEAAFKNLQGCNLPEVVMT